MKVLIVEDDKGKEQHLTEVVREKYVDAEVVERRSFQSGLKEALLTAPDIILLDMSIPTFDSKPSEGETGGQPRPYGGRDLLRELVRKKIISKVIVVTQYPVFGEGQEVMTLDQLTHSLAAQFPLNYVATVYYQSGQSKWRAELAQALAKATGSSGDAS